MLKILMILVAFIMTIIQIAICILGIPFVFLLLILAAIAEDITRKE